MKRCGDPTCPDPWCLVRCPECGGLDRHYPPCPTPVATEERAVSAPVYVDTASLTEDGAWWSLSVLFRRRDGAAPTREDMAAVFAAVDLASLPPVEVDGARLVGPT